MLITPCKPTVPKQDRFNPVLSTAILVNHNVERQRRRGAMSKLPFQLGIHPINWVGEDVKEHGDATTCAQILDDIQRLGLKGTEMGRKYPTDPATLREELSKRNIN